VNYLTIDGVIQHADLILFQGNQIAQAAAGEKHGALKRWAGVALGVLLKPADHERCCEDRL
jgi:hypothetical protein